MTRAHPKPRPAIRLLVSALVLVAVAGACGSSKKASSTSGAGASANQANQANRPTTAARIEIVEPAPNAKTGPDVTLKMNLIGAQVVSPDKVTGPLRGDEGHIHVSLDGQLVSMNYGLEAPLAGLKPGSHSVQAEFVAVDHAPFKNRVVAAVLFQVAAS